MTIQVGDTIPQATLRVRTKEGLKEVTTDELFKGRKVALFGVPGAFTPTCSAQHLPGFVQHAGEIRDKGVDTIACMAVNDPFVMDAWGAEHGAGRDVMMLSDGNAEFTRKLGLDMDASGFHMGTRCQRFSMVVDDGVVKEVNVEEPGAFKVSSAEHLLTRL